MTSPSVSRRSPLLAAVLSFIVPGLGQAWVGAVWRGALFAVPTFVLLGLGLALWTQGEGYAIGLLLKPGLLLAFIALNVAFIVYRGAGVLDAYRLARRRNGARRASGLRRAVSMATISALLVAIVATHGALAYVGYQAYDLVTTVFRPSGPQSTSGGIAQATASPTGSPSGSPGVATPAPTPTHSPEPPPPWGSDGRLDILLVGGDAGPGRWGLRTDTMILLSVDVATGRAALFGFPRNLVNVPLPPDSASAFACGCFPQLLNALNTYALDHPALFPGDERRGIHALEGAIEELAGVTLDGTVLADLNAFVKLVDALGGLDINVPYAVYDGHYPLEDGSRSVVLSIQAGQQHMDGHLALAYARSRHQDSDYGRMERQQLVLLALRRQVSLGSLLPRLGEIVGIVKDALWTDLPVDALPALVGLAQAVNPDRVSRVTFIPPTYPEYLGKLDWARIREVVTGAFPPLPDEIRRKRF